MTAIKPGQFYAHQCPETKRRFVCQEGVDNNICECFRRQSNELTAKGWACLFARLLNAIVGVEIDQPEE